MKYFKNAELAKLYNVSEKSIRNWIESALAKKIELDLYCDADRSYVADTLTNNARIEKLVEQGRKYRNQRSHRLLRPKKAFYETYTHDQILDICHELTIHREFPLKYHYFGDGGLYWEKYLNKLEHAGTPNLLTNTVQVINTNIAQIDALIQAYKHINIVNLCVGNSVGAKDLIRNFYEKGKLGRNIAIDISPVMLEITCRNIHDWFDGKVETEKYLRDVNYERFLDITAGDSFGEDFSETANIILLLAGPIVNFRDPGQVLKIIRESMGENDVLITTLKSDTPQTRRFFDFNVDSEEGLLNKHDSYLLDLLNIGKDYYELEQFFDESEMVRVIQIKMKLDLSIQIKTDHFQQIVNLKKGEAIRLWRSWHHSEENLIARFISSGYTVKGFSKSIDDQLMMIATKVKI